MLSFLISLQAKEYHHQIHQFLLYFAFYIACWFSVYSFLRWCNCIVLLTGKLWKFQKERGIFFAFCQGNHWEKGGTKFSKVKEAGQKRKRTNIFWTHRGPTYEDTVTQRSIKNTELYLAHFFCWLFEFFERFPEGSLDFVFILEILFLCKNTSGCFLPITSSISGKLIMSCWWKKGLLKLMDHPMKYWKIVATVKLRVII